MYGRVTECKGSGLRNIVPYVRQDCAGVSGYTPQSQAEARGDSNLVADNLSIQF